MDLANTTPLTAQLLVGQTDDPDLRAGCLVAKATYRFNNNGDLLMDLERPAPVLIADQETPRGLLPRDDLLFCQQHLEVILLGSAKAPGGARQLEVALTVDDQRRTLCVSGDRFWEPATGRATEAAPFASMPLTWERAFGGAQETWLTADSSVDVPHALNPAGRGFDPEPLIRGLTRGIYTADTYPRWDRLRPLPNVEAPGRQVTSPDDDPPPTCWAPAPLDSALFLARLGGVVQDQGQDVQPPDTAALAARAMHPEVLHRAHPTWVIPPPPARGTAVIMEGLTAWGRAAFTLPSPRLACDWRLGDHVGQRTLHLARLVLLPDEARFYLVYFCRFTYRRKPGQTRALRLRLES